MSIWMQAFHKRCENFQHVVMDPDDALALSSASTAPRTKSRHVFGADALRYRLERCGKLPLGHQDEQDLKDMRQFKWMLSDIEMKALDSWTCAKVVSSKDKIMNRQKSLANVEARVEKEKRRLGNGAEQSRLAVLAPPLKKNLVDEIIAPDEDLFGDEEFVTDDKNVDCTENTGVMSFFGAKAL